MKHFSLILAIVLVVGCTGMRNSGSSRYGSSGDSSGSSAADSSQMTAPGINDPRSVGGFDAMMYSGT